MWQLNHNYFFMEDDFKLIYEKIGYSIKAKRKELGLSQQGLADKIAKLDRSKISDMENGKEDFLLSTLLKICDALGTTLEKLVEHKNNRN